MDLQSSSALTSGWRDAANNSDEFSSASARLLSAVDSLRLTMRDSVGRTASAVGTQQQQQQQLQSMSAIEDLETSLSLARDAYRRRVFQLDHRVFELETLLDLRKQELNQQRDVNMRIHAQMNRVQAENDELSDALIVSERALARHESNDHTSNTNPDSAHKCSGGSRHGHSHSHCVDESTLVDVLSRVLHEHIDGRLESTQTRQVKVFVDAARDTLQSVLSPQLQTLKANLASDTAKQTYELMTVTLQRLKEEVLAGQNSAISAAMANTMGDKLESVVRESCEAVKVQMQQSEARTIVHLEQGTVKTSKLIEDLLDDRFTNAAVQHISKLDASLGQIQQAMRGDLGDYFHQYLVTALQEDTSQQSEQLRELFISTVEEHATRITDALRLVEKRSVDDRSAVANEVVSQIAVQQTKCLSRLDELSAQTQQHAHLLADESVQNDARAQTLFAKHNDTALRCREVKAAVEQSSVEIRGNMKLCQDALAGLNAKQQHATAYDNRGKGQTLRKIKAHLTSLDRENLNLQDENRSLANKLRQVVSDNDKLVHQEKKDSSVLFEKLVHENANLTKQLADAEADKAEETHTLRQQCDTFENKLGRMELALERERSNKRERQLIKREAARRARERMEQQMDGLLSQMAKGESETEASSGESASVVASASISAVDFDFADMSNGSDNNSSGSNTDADVEQGSPEKDLSAQSD